MVLLTLLDLIGSHMLLLKKNLSANYNVSEIFSCSYAPYFYEAIRIRFPEYTREMSKGITKENNFER